MNKLLTIVLLFLTISVYSQEHILIGDSQTLLLSKHSKIVHRDKQLCKGGTGIDYLITQAKTHPISKEVKSVIIVVGVNDLYNFSNNKFEQLFKLIRIKFPNSKIYFIKGSWGWGGTRNLNRNTVEIYSEKVKRVGAIIIKTPIGFGDPHNDKIEYKIIMSEVEYFIKK
jgi:hypothetical protein